MSDLVELGAVEAAARIRSGDLCAEAYAEALLGRARAFEHLNAFIAIDAESVREAARAADAARERGDPMGPLHGVPLAIKDNIDVAGQVTTGGTPALRGHRAQADAAVMRPLLEAGALVLGKANLHELAFGVTTNNGAFGAARNPYDPARVPGGSSGGTGVAVAARLAPAGLGSDTGGSVRIPAALCGVIGFRPTTGRYPSGGIVPIAHTRDTAGPMARAMEDIVLLDGLVAGGRTELPPAGLQGLRIGVPRRYFYDDNEPGVAAAVADALSRFAGYGIELVEADIPSIQAAHEAANFPVILYEALPDLERYLEGTGLDARAVIAELGSQDVREIVEPLLGEGAIPEPVYRAALDIHRPRLQAIYRDYFAENGLAAAVFPTTPIVAEPIDPEQHGFAQGADVPAFQKYDRNVSPASNAGIPSLSLPIGLTGTGLPVGVTLDGPEGTDETLLAIGLALAAREPALPAPDLTSPA